ncbi:hypothetical protein ZYGR_0N07280 [Zygosaccharomyces rouxii]|uniref:Uncharacterized protein n=1 Tax=Zygosaccharomyces rouxii TaxID=4956 RepID=A0A1Q3A0W2_ZYGRO|nr:hypothetical protein ZYGR_0N07280 [Zygosaccharomyces rouxii]
MLMVNETRMLKFKQVQQEHVGVLRELLAFCETLRPSPKAAQKYMKDVKVILEFVTNSLKVLIAKHTLVTSPSELLPARLFADVELLNTYKDVLFGSIKLIFNKDTSAFRMRTEPNFTQSVIKIYMALIQFHHMWAAETLQLKSMIHAFQYQFGSNYNIANCNILNLNQVHDLLSQTFDLVSPPLLDIRRVAKRDYFRLTTERFGYRELLVEIFQLSNGELAIFKVNCGELPAPTNSSSHLLQRLAEGESNLLNLGRTLLFPALREYDLEVVTLIDSGTELRTPTGSDVHLQLQCVDAMQWESHWKFCFQKLFDKKNVIPPLLQSSTLAPMARSSHPFQSFKFKHQKLEDLRPDTYSGIAIQMPQQVVESQKAKENSIKDFKQNSFKLHKSKPLQRPLSSMMQDIDLNDTPKRSASDNSMFKSPSLRDIEQLSCSKLLELDKSIDMNLSQTALETPEMKECKTMSQHSSIEKTDPVVEGDIEVIDIESDDDTDGQESSIFNPTADIYKPSFHNRKSFSLLSLFKPKSKKNSNIDTSNDSGFSLNNQNSSSSLFGPRSATSSSLSSKSSMNSLLKSNNGVGIPSGIGLNNESTIFESKITRVSSWNGRLWEPIKAEKLKLTIVKSNKNETVLVVHEEKEIYFCKLAARITPQWKCSRGGAQDVQLNVPFSEFMANTFSEGGNFLNIRCVEANRLQNFLQHCIKGDVIPAHLLSHSLPNSMTAGTLSSNGSSLLSDHSSSMISDSSAFKLAASAANTRLLLPNIKVKRYVHSETTTWQEQLSTMVDLYACEYKGLLLRVLFKFLENGKNDDTLLVGLNDIRRIGTTGLLLVCRNEEQFLEFQNKAVADHVYRLIRP